MVWTQPWGGRAREEAFVSPGREVRADTSRPTRQLMSRTHLTEPWVPTYLVKRYSGCFCEGVSG